MFGRVLLALLALVLLASDVSRAADAPSIQDLEATLADLEGRLEDADAIAVALGLVHAAWADLGAPGVRRRACEPGSEAQRLAALSTLLVAAHAEAADGVAALLPRLDAQVAAPTIEPLLLPVDRGRIARDRSGAERLARTRSAFGGWHKRHIAPAAKGCPATPPTGPGFVDPVAGREGPVAVIAMDGVLCPGAVRASGVVLLEAGTACWASASCDCTPASHLPGAVLGP